MKKLKLLFVYNHEYSFYWQDGLYAAITELEKDFKITWLNLAKPTTLVPIEYDFVLGWGAFNGPVDYFIQGGKSRDNICSLGEAIDLPKGLCVAGNTYPTKGWEKYDVLFYETEWSKKWLTDQGVDESKLVHAFGINSNIYKPNFYISTTTEDPYEETKIWDYLTVGAFADWKRQRLLASKEGYNLAIGEIQKGNPVESLDIIGDLILRGVSISDMIDPRTLAKIYRASRTVYIPADLFGGGERAILEARACGVDVEVEEDNPKLQELTKSPVWDHYYYAEQLKKGIKKCLKS